MKGVETFGKDQDASVGHRLPGLGHGIERGQIADSSHGRIAPQSRHPVGVFGKAGEAAAEYLTKGWLVAVDGRLEYGEWESDGTKRHDYTVVGYVEFLTAPRPAEEPAPAKPARNGARPSPPRVFVPAPSGAGTFL